MQEEGAPWCHISADKRVEEVCEMRLDGWMMGNRAFLVSIHK